MAQRTVAQLGMACRQGQGLILPSRGLISHLSKSSTLGVRKEVVNCQQVVLRSQAQESTLLGPSFFVPAQEWTSLQTSRVNLSLGLNQGTDRPHLGQCPALVSCFRRLLSSSAHSSQASSSTLSSHSPSSSSLSSYPPSSYRPSSYPSSSSPSHSSSSSSPSSSDPAQSSPSPSPPSTPPPSPPPDPAAKQGPRRAQEEATVVIVGRPNVGKSALYNRLIRRREALVLDTPQGHMTRDVREGQGHLFGLTFRVFDTAGLEPLYAPPLPSTLGTPQDHGASTPGHSTLRSSGAETGPTVGAPWEGEWEGGGERGPAESAAGPSPPSVLRRTANITSFLVQQADAVLFLFDARAGILPGDLEVADWLRKTLASPPTQVPLNSEIPPNPETPEIRGDSQVPRILLVANKCENFSRDHRGLLLAHVAESYALGFGDPVPISAETGEGLDDLFARLQEALPSGEESAFEDNSTGLADDSLEHPSDSLAAAPQSAVSTGPTLEHSRAEGGSGQESTDARSREVVPEEGETREIGSGELGLGEVVSGQVMPGTGELSSLEMVPEAFQQEQPPLQLAIAGVPNVGKSTLVNALLGAERVLTGPEPGLTRDSVRVRIVYEGKPIWLVDTAGWLKRAESAEKGPASLAQVDTERSLMRAHVVVLVVDGVEVTSEQKAMRRVEQSLARWVLQNGRALVLVVNKMDAIGEKLGPPEPEGEGEEVTKEEGGRRGRGVREGSAGERAGNRRGEESGRGLDGSSEGSLERQGAEQASSELRGVDLSGGVSAGSEAFGREAWKHRRWLRKRVRAAVTAEVGSLLQQVPEVPVVFVSALHGQGREELMQAVTKAYSQWCTTVSPSQLRHWLPKVLMKLPGQRAAASVKSVSQLKARPPTFAVVGAKNNPPSTATLKFLGSEIASSFRMESVPIRMVVRARRSTTTVQPNEAPGKNQTGPRVVTSKRTQPSV